MNDWEGDTIRTTPAKGCIVTLVDRKIRYLAAKGVDSVSSQKVHDAIKEAFYEKGIHYQKLKNVQLKLAFFVSPLCIQFLLAEHVGCLKT